MRNITSTLIRAEAVNYAVFGKLDYLEIVLNYL